MIILDKYHNSETVEETKEVKNITINEESHQTIVDKAKEEVVNTFMKMNPNINNQLEVGMLHKTNNRILEVETTIEDTKIEIY